MPPILPPLPLHSMPSQTFPMRDAASGDAAMRSAAQGLEATFLSEMLKAAGFGRPLETFGGGIGEDQFSSFLRDAQASEMVRSGGIGLAERLFEAMKAPGDAGR